MVSGADSAGGSAAVRIACGPQRSTQTKKDAPGASLMKFTSPAELAYGATTAL